MDMKTVFFAGILSMSLSQCLLSEDEVTDPWKNNIFVSKLPGNWKLDATVSQRLTGQSVPRQQIGRDVTLGPIIRFDVDSRVASVAKDEIVKLLKGNSILLSGYCRSKAATVPYVLSIINGNPMLAFGTGGFGRPFAQAEGALVMIVNAIHDEDDILFIGGDEFSDPFVAYRRLQKQPDKSMLKEKFKMRFPHLAIRSDYDISKLFVREASVRKWIYAIVQDPEDDTSLRLDAFQVLRSIKDNRVLASIMKELWPWFVSQPKSRADLAYRSQVKIFSYFMVLDSALDDELVMRYFKEINPTDWKLLLEAIAFKWPKTPVSLSFDRSRILRASERSKALLKHLKSTP